MSRILAAVDLGASSGRVIAGVLTDGRFDLRETVRFPNRPYRLPTPRGIACTGACWACGARFSRACGPRPAT